MSKIKETRTKQLFPAAATWADWCDTPAPEIDFVLGALPAGGVGVLSGGDGTGKSMLALEMAVAVAGGVPVAGGAIPAPEHTGPVVYITGEDQAKYWHTRVHRLAAWLRTDRKLRGDPRELPISLRCLEGTPMPLMAHPSLGPSNGEPQETGSVSAFSAAISGARLAIIDPLIMFHGLDENNVLAMDRMMRLLTRLASESECAILVVHHASQSAILGGRDDHHAGRGSTALPAAGRAIWVLRSMTAEEATTYDICETDRRLWKRLATAKATHADEGNGTWLRREPGGILVHAPLRALPSRKTRKRPTSSGYADWRPSYDA